MCANRTQILIIDIDLLPIHINAADIAVLRPTHVPVFIHIDGTRLKHKPDMQTTIGLIVRHCPRNVYRFTLTQKTLKMGINFGGISFHRLKPQTRAEAIVMMKLLHKNGFFYISNMIYVIDIIDIEKEKKKIQFFCSSMT